MLVQNEGFCQGKSSDTNRFWIYNELELFSSIRSDIAVESYRYRSIVEVESSPHLMRLIQLAPFCSIERGY